MNHVLFQGGRFKSTTANLFRIFQKALFFCRKKNLVKKWYLFENSRWKNKNLLLLLLLREKDSRKRDPRLKPLSIKIGQKLCPIIGLNAVLRVSREEKVFYCGAPLKFAANERSSYPHSTHTPITDFHIPLNEGGMLAQWNNDYPLVRLRT